MSKRSALVVLLLAFALPLAAAPKARYLVMTRAPLREAHGVLRNTLDSADREVRPFANLEAFAADLTDDEASAMRREGGVRIVERVVERHVNDAPGAFKPRATPAYVSYSDHQTIPWGIDAIHARDVWPFTRGAGVNVAVIDTGIDLAHPDLKRAYAGGYNTLSPADPPQDDNHHGTHVAGTIAATDNGFGVVGAAPDVRLWAVKVLDQTGNGDSEHVAAGLDWILSKKKELGGNWIANLSLGSVLESDVEAAMFARAIAEGVAVMAAAGNSALEFIDYPAGYPGVMPIGALDTNGTAAVWENRGALSVVAPGVGVLSTIPLGIVRATDITLGADTILEASPLKGSPLGEVKGTYVLCGFGHPSDFPASVKGNIAVISRGEIFFKEKARNAKAAGAAAVVIYSRPEDLDNMTLWSLVDVCDSNGVCTPDPVEVAFDWPLTLGVSSAAGQQIVNGAGTLSMIASNRSLDYLTLSGTSMATPHVAAAAALAWSLVPQLSSTEIRLAIEAAAHDTGAPGYDTTYGNGTLDALATAKLVAPEKFGITPRRRGALH
jgi:serine protease